MVLTSLSLHMIAILIWMLAAPPHSAYSLTKVNEGPSLVLTRQIVPDRVSPPATKGTPPPPAPHPAVPAPAVAKNPAPVVPKKKQPESLESILSPGGAPHLEGGVVFVLDISGSMYEAFNGSNRLALARQLLNRQIIALPNGTPFAVTLYGETTLRSGPLVAASPATREAAVRYIAEDYNCGGGTNLPAGLDVAAALHPDNLVLVTDGDLNIANKKLMSEARRILGPNGPNLSVIAIAPRPKTDDELILRNLVRQQAGTYESIGSPSDDADAGASPSGDASHDGIQ